MGSSRTEDCRWRDLCQTWWCVAHWKGYFQALGAEVVLHRLPQHHSFPSPTFTSHLPPLTSLSFLLWLTAMRHYRICQKETYFRLTSLAPWTTDRRLLTSICTMLTSAEGWEASRASRTAPALLRFLHARHRWSSSSSASSRLQRASPMPLRRQSRHRAWVHWNGRTFKNISLWFRNLTVSTRDAWAERKYPTSCEGRNPSISHLTRLTSSFSPLK